MYLNTDAILPDGRFDPRYTCDADNSSPELQWGDVPAQTQSFALVMEDLDVAGLYSHWVIAVIPAELRHLPAGIPPQEMLPNGIRQGINDARKLGYFGPCPPRLAHKPHRYRIRLYALSAALGQAGGGRWTRDSLVSAIGPLILASAEVLGTYQRARIAPTRKAG